MSIIRKAICALVVLSVLAFQSVSRAETQGLEGQPGIAGAVVKSATDRLGSFATALTTPAIDLKELQCLARNIFFEAGGEPEEGKVAVGLVTLNRVQDGRFAGSVCAVVDQRVTRVVERHGTREVKTTFSTRTEPVVTREQLTICQFSWRCMFVKNPKSEDDRWVESQRVARELLEDTSNYQDYRAKYAGALYFHAVAIKPSWVKAKDWVGRIGGHHFYQEQPRALASRN